MVDSISEGLLIAGCEDVASIHVLAHQWRWWLGIGAVVDKCAFSGQPAPVAALRRRLGSQSVLNACEAAVRFGLTEDRWQAKRSLDGAEPSFDVGEDAQDARDPVLVDALAGRRLVDRSRRCWRRLRPFRQMCGDCSTPPLCDWIGKRRLRPPMPFLRRRSGVSVGRRGLQRGLFIAG